MKNIEDIAKDGRKPGQFEGRFLVSMPDMESDIFAHSVIYVCAHGEDGAIGFIVNRAASMNLLELISHADIGDDDAVDIDNNVAFSSVREGGPVDTHRGFVLHRADYKTTSTVSVGSGLFLTSTVQVLRAIAMGVGPSEHAVMLGYSGWSSGQLEMEIANNTWLVIDGQSSLVLDEDHTQKYAIALANMGITSANFISEAGRA